MISGSSILSPSPGARKRLDSRPYRRVVAAVELIEGLVGSALYDLALLGDKNLVGSRMIEVETSGVPVIRRKRRVFQNVGERIGDLPLTA